MQFYKGPKNVVNTKSWGNVSMTWDSLKYLGKKNVSEIFDF